MRRLLIFIFSVLPIVASAIGIESTVSLLDRLDSALAHSDEFASMRLARVASMRKMQESPHITDEQLYDLNEAIAREFEVFQFDSTINYLYWNLGIARELHDQYKVDQSIIALGRVHATAGYYLDANNMLNIQLDTVRLNPNLLDEYYWAQYCLNNQMYSEAENPSSMGVVAQRLKYYRKRLLEILSINSFEYRILRVSQFLERGELDKAERVLVEMMDNYKGESQEQSIVAYYLSELYNRKGDKDMQLHFATLAALSEVRLAIRDNIALNALAVSLFDDGDVTRAFRLSRATLDFALAYNAKSRVWQVASILPTIESAYRAKQQNQSNYFYIFFTVVLVLLMILLVIHLIQRSQREKLDRTQQQLQEANRNLVDNNKSLQAFNDQLSQLNGDIAEANAVKEEYIALFLRVYSECIDKMEGLQRRVRKLATHDNLAELKRELSKSDLVDEELVYFYEMFDNAFLRLYPNFVSEFNSLLEEDARIELKKDEKLNTELRIFALIRLGINDSSKIAALLRYSVNTIYNYRAKVKNKACVSREEFEERIKKIGSFQNVK